MQVKLLAYTPEPEKTVACAAKLCYAAADIDTVYDILVAGTAKAVETTNETLAQVRKAMRIDYFTDRSIVKEWETLLRKANQ